MTTRALKLEIEGPLTSRRLLFSLDRTIWIGRDEACDVVLPSDLVSRRHLSIAHRNGELLVTDTSSNGTAAETSVVHRSSAAVAIGTSLGVGPYRVWARIVSVGEDATAASPTLRRRMHGLLVERIDHRKLEPGRISDEVRSEVRTALTAIVSDEASDLETSAQRRLVQELEDEALGLGPLEPLLVDQSVTEVMVVDPRTVFVERRGKLERATCAFTDAESVRGAIERIVTPLGRRIDESAPLVDARLPDGSRVNAVIPPVAVRGPCITIRKFRDQSLGLPELVRGGALTERMRSFLERSVRVRKNVVISGGTGSGKTTLLNALSAVVPEAERLVTVEDAAELRLLQPHVVTLEAKGPNREGKGAYTIRDLVKNALRMRPDRIVVGECRGGEALDMLQAMNTGHEGSMTTVHANSPEQAIHRLETLCLMSGLDLPLLVVRRQIASSLHVIVQTRRFSDGTRRISEIAEVVGLSDTGEVRVEDVFRFHKLETGASGEILGEFLPTGHVPTFMDEFIASGVVPDGDYL